MRSGFGQFRSAAKLPSPKMRRIAANVAKLPELLGRHND
jgi:hypothetical protein